MVRIKCAKRVPHNVTGVLALPLFTHAEQVIINLPQNLFIARRLFFTYIDDRIWGARADRRLGITKRLYRLAEQLRPDLGYSSL